jgi:hypothetical protein
LLPFRNFSKVAAERKLKRLLVILSIVLQSLVVYSFEPSGNLRFDFFGNGIEIPADRSFIIPFNATPTQETVKSFYEEMNTGHYQPVVDALLRFRDEHKLNDWLYYQLVRKTAQQFSPKAENYPRYTLYKWFLLAKSGYDATLAVSNEKILFYVRSNENIYDIPYYMHDGNQYVCLNKHDYNNINFEKDGIYPISINVPEATTAFSYKVTQLPEFADDEYAEKDLQFNYNNKLYHFKVMVNPEVQNIFLNYPVVDYESYFNIPLSHKTYSSLIPALKENVQHMKQKQGVDYLMQFTRNAFLYEDDQKNFGKEKRMSPEQTLLNKYSDCDDRAALFFYLVKEVYNLPMIVLLYPSHVTIAVKFDKVHGGQTIDYNGNKYLVCEPTPQAEDLSIGQIAPELKKENYQVAYVYDPQ